VAQITAAALLLLAASGAGCAWGGGDPAERIRTQRNLLTGYPARNPDGTVNAAIEIPAGTNAKWEATKDGEAVAWERQRGRLRVVHYLPYPANYGMVPGTLLPREDGGDGDPLDVLLLGPARDRGEVVPARLVGVLRLLDDGERDDKLLAVDLEGPLGGVTDLDALERDFPGVTAILDGWFAHYKGPGRIETRGFGDRASALEVLGLAERGFAGAGP
jgi:inorganic pyrophosphatase